MRTRIRMTMVAGAALSVAVAACGTGGSGTSSGGGTGSLKTGPGVDTSTKTVTAAILSPLSGPVAVIGKYLTRGQEVYFQALNARGGVSGYAIKTVEKDDQYNPQLHVQLYNEVVGDSAFIAQSLGSPTTKAIQPLADQQDVLVGAAAQSSSFVTDPHLVTIGTPYAVDMANTLDYIVNKLGAKDARIALVYQNDEYGQDGLRGYQAALSAYHFNDVARVTYNATDTDFSAQVVQLKNAGAQYVMVTATPKPAATIVGTGAAGGYLPRWFFQGPAYTEFALTSDGTPNGTRTPVYPALAATTLVMGYEAQWGDTSVPGMKQMLADVQKYAPDEIPDYNFEYGYAEAEVEAAIVKKAIDGGDISRAGLLKARESLGHFSFGGLLPDLTYTSTPGAADRQTEISKIDPTVPGFLKLVQPYFEGQAAKSLSL